MQRDFEGESVCAVCQLSQRDSVEIRFGRAIGGMRSCLSGQITITQLDFPPR